ncbi:MAG: hypothetical protein VX747_01820, partial [Actinomycetota bacterium]|nr:hypothetical protein [Actinomycetota bacterium]
EEREREFARRHRPDSNEANDDDDDENEGACLACLRFEHARAGAAPVVAVYAVLARFLADHLTLASPGLEGADEDPVVQESGGWFGGLGGS